MHKHHIVPKHMGGTDDENNLVYLTVEEHAEAHKKLYEEHGQWQDYIAWQGLAGLMTKEELVRKMLSESGKKGAALTNVRKDIKRGPKPGTFKPVGTKGTKWYHNPETKQTSCFRADQQIPEGWIQGRLKRL